ncbi:MAG TPA: DegT/DnrJ/EryC1/StrS family aminotransferase [Rhodocyclaceae bacterium]|nr:DegT/DnrJ/EryC1/StrS family aminotransferase [Rhodocyclaceae bacterium]
MPTSTAREEIPPTAGLPLGLRDLLPARQADFPGAMADFLGVPRVGVECSGTACLVVILKTLQRLSPRRTVVVPAYTCPLVVFAVTHCGLQLRLCDLAPGSFELCPEALQRVCDSDTLAVLPTHLGGRVADLAPILAVAAHRGAFVVEDAAQALGAREAGRRLGLAGDAGFFSLAAGKGLSLFEGGVWVARDPAMAAELARTSAETIPAQFWQEAFRCLQLLGYAALYRPGPLRYAYGAPLRRALKENDPVAAAGDEFSPDIPLHRVSAWRQAVGCRGLSRLPGFQAALRTQALARLPRLAGLPGVKVFGDRSGEEGTWPFFMLLLPDRQTRDAVMAELWGSGLGLARMFANALPDYEYLRPWVAPADCPNARDFADRSLTVTNSLWLDNARFERIVAALERHLR